jgi:hypothetical protein
VTHKIKFEAKSDGGGCCGKKEQTIDSMSFFGFFNFNFTIFYYFLNVFILHALLLVNNED